MNYSKEVLNKINEIKENIDKCEDLSQAVVLQIELLNLLQITLNDEKFKRSLIETKGLK